jgi:predicted cupin superfamily sugar epimerase
MWFENLPNSRVMIDSCQELNPNNTRLRVAEPVGTDWDSAGECHLVDPLDNRMKAVELTEDELLICCLTVPGFSFGDSYGVSYFLLTVVPSVKLTYYYVVEFAGR